MDKLFQTRRAGHNPIRVKPGETLAEALAARSPSDLIPTPLSDVNDLDAVVHALGIEDSDTTPAEAVAELKAEIEQLRTSLIAANAAADAEMERVKACEHIAEGTDGWEAVRNVCPSASAVAGLRDNWEALRAALVAMVDRWEPDAIGTDRRMWEDAQRALGREV